MALTGVTFSQVDVISNLDSIFRRRSVGLRPSSFQTRNSLLRQRVALFLISLSLPQLKRNTHILAALSSSELGARYPRGRLYTMGQLLLITVPCLILHLGTKHILHFRLDTRPLGFLAFRGEYTLLLQPTCCCALSRNCPLPPPPRRALFSRNMGDAEGR